MHIMKVTATANAALISVLAPAYVPSERFSRGLGWFAGGFSWSTSLRMGLCVREDFTEGAIIAQDISGVT
jgi:hypothetical protein